jgi:hypothetical protein
MLRSATLLDLESERGAGNTFEESLKTVLPQDELFVYEDALRQERENEGGTKEQKA